MNPCPSDALLNDFHAAALDPARHQSIAKHLAECPDCAARDRDLLLSTDRIMNDLRGLRDEASPLGPEPTLTQGSAEPNQPRRVAQNAASHTPLPDPSPPMFGPPIGSPRIEGYSILRELGRGGMGLVYEAIQTKLNRKVALKVLPAGSGALRKESVERFRREATAAAHLHHTNIVPVYDFGQSGHAHYYAMELISGRSVSELIREFDAAGASSASVARLAELLEISQAPGAAFEHPSDTAKPPSAASRHSRGTTGGKPYYRLIAQWIADAADALHYAHGQGIIHRDIKPGNLMISSDGRIMIMDFGLAKTVDDLSVTQTGSLIGTLSYMSPEQAMAKRMKLDHRTDVYSLGATMYELLSFRAAFKGADEKETLGQIITRDPTPPRKIAPSVPREMETICLKTLEKDPGRRYATAKDMADDLRRYLSDMPIVAKPTGPVGRAVKLVRRRRTLSVTIVAIIAVSTAGWIARTALSQKETALRQKEMALRAETLQKGEKLLRDAEHFWTEGDYEGAEREFREAEKLMMTDARPPFNIASLYVQRFQATADKAWLGKARQEIDRAVKLTPSRPEYLNVQGVVARYEGRIDEAIDIHRRANQVDSGYYRNWVSLGRAYTEKKDWTAAADAFRRSLSLQEGKGEVMAWVNLLMVQIITRSSDAETTLAKTPLAVRQDRFTQIASARYYLFNSDSGPAAEDVLASAAALPATNEDSPRLASRIARVKALIFLRQSQPEKALATSADIAQDDPASAAFRNLIASIASAQLGDRTTATREFELAAQQWPLDLQKAQVLVNNQEPFMWFEDIRELERLRDDAKSLLAQSPAQDPADETTR